MKSIIVVFILLIAGGCATKPRPPAVPELTGKPFVPINPQYRLKQPADQSVLATLRRLHFENQANRDGNVGIVHSL